MDSPEETTPPPQPASSSLPKVKSRPRDTRDMQTRIKEAILDPHFALSLARLQLESIDPLLSECKDFLTMLEAGYNKFTDVDPVIFTLFNLSALGLSHNAITTISPKIKSLTNLTHLYLTSNRLTQLPQEIGSLQHLQVLSVYNNQLSSIPATLGNCKNLKQLLLSCNKLQYIPNEIGNCTLIDTISLNNNPLKKLPDTIGNLSHLNTVFLHNCHLKTIPATFGKLLNLTLLDLTNNRLEYLPMEELIKLPYLKGKKFGIPAFSLDKNPKLPSPPRQIQLLGVRNVYAWFNNLAMQHTQKRPRAIPPTPTPPGSIPQSPTGSPGITPRAKQVSTTTSEDSMESPSLSWAGDPTSFHQVTEKPKSSSQMSDIQDGRPPRLPPVISCRHARFGCSWIGEPSKESAHNTKVCQYEKVKGLLDYVFSLENRLERAIVHIVRQNKRQDGLLKKLEVLHQQQTLSSIDSPIDGPPKLVVPTPAHLSLADSNSGPIPHRMRPRPKHNHSIFRDLSPLRAPSRPILGGTSIKVSPAGGNPRFLEEDDDDDSDLEDIDDEIVLL